VNGSFGWLERDEAEALRTDRYLELLLAGEQRPDAPRPDAPRPHAMPGQPVAAALPGRTTPAGHGPGAAAPMVGDLVDTAAAAPVVGDTTDTTDPVDPEIAEAARRLHAEAVRIHPSFRFEERLARRLANAAAGMRLAAAAGGGADAVIAFPVVPAPDGLEPTGRGAVRPMLFGGALVGGALTSAAISIAGAAFVAWRRSRSLAFAADGPGTGARVRLRVDARRRLD
jgi:hypothetical protein